MEHRKDVSFALTVFFLKIVGFWLSGNRVEEWFRNVTVMYTVVALIFSMWVQMRNLYFLWGDFSLCAYIMCNSLGLFVDLFKISIIFIHKKKFLGLIVHMQKNFWHFNYDRYENLIIADTKRMCIYFVCAFSFFSQSTVSCYMLRPLILNIGKNESDRTLIFNMWLDLPLSMTPYFEITYLIQVVALFQTGVCYLSFDNMFCIMCLHVAGQFRVLQYRMANSSGIKDKDDNNENQTVESSSQCYATFKNCIEQHKALIEFCATLEEIFNVILLGQVVSFSILISFIGYQVILVDLSFYWRFSFVTFLLTIMWQLWIFTYSCDCVTHESLNVASAVYAGSWIHLPMDKFGSMIRKDLQLVMKRSERPCYLTASGFFPVSLQTFTKIMSTAMSYFTILKQRTVDETDT